MFYIIISLVLNLCPRMMKEHRVKHSYCFCSLLQWWNSKVPFNNSVSWLHFLSICNRSSRALVVFKLSYFELAVFKWNPCLCQCYLSRFVCVPLIWSHSLGALKAAVLTHQVLSLAFTFVTFSIKTPSMTDFFRDSFGHQFCANWFWSLTIRNLPRVLTFPWNSSASNLLQSTQVAKNRV